MALVFFELKEFLDLGLGKRKGVFKPAPDLLTFPITKDTEEWREFMKKLFDEAQPKPVIVPWQQQPYLPPVQIDPWQPYQPCQPITIPWTQPWQRQPLAPYIGDPLPNQNPYTGTPLYYYTTTDSTVSMLVNGDHIGLNTKNSSPKTSVKTRYTNCWSPTNSDIIAAHKMIQHQLTT